MAYCEQNVETIFGKLKPYLLTNDRDHAQALANRSQRIFKPGPGAIGYYVGYKICEGYLKTMGEDRWTDLYTLPVREILTKSGY